MKKITSFVAIIALTLVSYTANAQYYVNTYNPAGQNPGDLNNDPEQPLAFLNGNSLGYTAVLTATTNNLRWSGNQTIPFTFNFNGNPVTQYKVSSSGVLTFTTSAVAVPSYGNNTALPSASIPDNSICIWGLQQSGANDEIGSKTFGTAPNRQHWIDFLSYSSPSSPGGSNWTYWAIVLEETTNNIYIVDKRTFTTPLSLTIGVQINDSTAIQLPASPNVPSVVTNGGNASDATDNVYHTFSPGTKPSLDAELFSVDVDELVSTSGVATIAGRIYNAGSTTLTSVDVNWSADGGTTVNSETFNVNLANGDFLNFTHGTTWTPTNVGSFTTIDVWLSNPNSGTDANNLNDSSASRVFVNSGNTVQRKVLLEEFTTAVCQFCPDGTVVVNRITDNNPNVIAVGVHSCFGTDAMTNADASTICATLGNNSAPTAMIDRIKFDGDAEPAHSRNLWEQRANARSQVGSPVSVNLTGSYDTTNRNINVNVDVIFVDAPFPGNGTINISLLVLEDSVVGTGNGYNQINFYNNTAGHPYQGAGNPIVGFPHRHVLRDILPTTWGDATVIPSTITINNTYSRNFTFQLDNNWDEKQVSLVAVVNREGATNADYEVLNATSRKLAPSITGISKEVSTATNFKIYPNPSANQTNLQFELTQNERVEVEILDITGKILRKENYGVRPTGSQLIQLNTSEFSNGFYFVKVIVGEDQVVKKISVIK